MLSNDSNALSGHNFCIIAGTQKGGTTSLFHYLQQHPEIVSAHIKQTFFFADPEIRANNGISSLFAYEDGEQEFLKNFDYQGKDKIYLDATPDYMYSPGTAKRLNELGKRNSVKIIFMLRDPVKRFQSFYRFAKQLDLIDDEMTVSDFLKLNQQHHHTIRSFSLSNISNFTLETGHYAKYIKPYCQLANLDLEVVYFEDLIANPEQALSSLFQWMGTNTEPAKKIDYKIHNKSKTLKSASLRRIYMGLRTGVLEKTSGPLRLNMVNAGRKFFAPLYHKLNYNPGIKEKLPKKVEDFLDEEYKEEGRELEILGFKKPTW